MRMIKQSLKMGFNRNNAKNSTNKSWIHPPEALQNGHVAYLVKFLGNIEVDQAKGIDVVKDGIRKLKFNQQLKKAEGTKLQKVEVTISIDGLAIQDQKTKQIFHQYPLHRISYCANDKSDKKFFSFIAKEETGEKHRCFVFGSDKLAEDITLTIGEAFDLAYRKFLETSGRDLETKKQLMILQKKVQELEQENAMLRQKIEKFHGEKDSNHMTNGQANLLNGDSIEHHAANKRNDSLQNKKSVCPSEELFSLISLPVAPSVGTRLENLVLDDMEDFNPRESTHPTHNNNNKALETDLFGAPPFAPPPQEQQQQQDPFGMGDFSNMGDLENAIGEIDKRITEMRDGFQRGLSFGNEDFFDSN